jgi:TonB-linked SusC/RagA family outer membrane protein
MKRKLTLLFICLITSIGIVTAQDSKVTGVVTSSEDGQPIIGASVLVIGTTTGTITDFNGTFNLNVPKTAKTLRISYVGMQSVEVAIKPNLKVVLNPNAKELDEVVVIAYGTQSSKSVTSSIATVKSDALKDVPSVSVDQMLQGRASGISITTPSAAVGQSPVVSIRGISTINSGTQPLYVVDGMPITSGDLASMGNANALADINPADILSIDVLKDASASSMYGSRAANGVILITTKKGKSGSSKVSYDMNIGYSEPTDFIKVLNAKEYTDFKNQAVKNIGGSETFETMTDSKGRLIDTNWADHIYKNGLSQNHTVALSGGNDKTDYYMSANYTQNEGIVIGDNYHRLSLKANASVKATDWLKVGINTIYSKSKTAYMDGSRNGGTFSGSGLARLAIILPSNMPAYDDDGMPYYEYGRFLGYGNNSVVCTNFNPIALHEYGNNVTTRTDRIIASAYAEITPIENLTLKSQYGIDRATIEDNRFWNALHGDGYKSSSDLSVNGVANGEHANKDIWTWTNTANYKYELNKHHFDFLLGMEASNDRYKYWSVQGSGITDNAFSGIEADYSSYQHGGNKFEKSMISYFGRINYDWDYKYMLSVNMRRDGYSPLGNDTRWGNFGGASVAWRISSEPFMEKYKDYVNDLKIKASWGLVGNSDIGYYPSKSTYAGTYYGTKPSYVMGYIKDSSLKWESTNNYDFGISARLMDCVSVDMDIYYSRSKNLILDIPQAPSTGIYGSSLTGNAGSMENRGLELAVSVDILRDGPLKWTSSANVTFNKNKVLKLTDNILSSDDGNFEYNNITVEGKSIGQLYLYKTGGIDPETGRRIFYSTDGERLTTFNKRFYKEDGTVFGGSLKQEMFGNTKPTYFGGWTNSFAYKGFDLNIFFQFSGGNKIYNGTKASSSDMRSWNNRKDVLTKSWKKKGDKATYAFPIYGDNYSNGSAYSISDWVEKGDYIRLKNISLGYTFNTKNWSKKIGISSLRLYAQAQNLFVISSYSGMDPEVLSNVMSPSLSGGIDKNTLPQARTYTFGLNVSF